MSASHPKIVGFALALLTILVCCIHSLVNAQEHDGHSHHDEHNEEGREKLSTALVWVAAMVTQLVMTVISAIGILLIPLLATRPTLNRHVMTGLIAMAAGTLLADAIVHLIPHALIPHGLLELDQLVHKDLVNATDPPSPGCTFHGDHWDCVGQTFNVGDPVFLTKLEPPAISHSSVILTMFLVLIGVYLFYLVELIMHSRRKNRTDPSIHSSNSSIRSTYHNGINMNETDFHAHSVKPVAWLILIGDSLHNFFDGLAVGVSYATSWSMGISTSVAVLLHELPHELGDYAVMIESGIPKFRAALYNMASNLTAFVGAAIGIAIFNVISDLGQRLILAITAGGFIYIALADLVPLLFSMTFPTASHHTPGVGTQHHHHHHSTANQAQVLPGDSPVDKQSETSASNHISGAPSEPLPPDTHPPIPVEHKGTSVPYSLILCQNLGLFIGVGFMIYLAVYQDNAH